jgi:AcrR family transcriptional regulator
VSQLTGTRVDALEKRERVLAAARSLLAERGLQAEMKEIADRAGVGVGTVYRNFATKEELVDAIIAEMLAGFDEALEEAERIDDPVEALLHLVHAGWDTVENNGEIIEALIRDGYEKVERRDARVETWTRIFQRGIERGVFREDVPRDFVHDFLETSIPLSYWQLRRRWDREATRRYCEAMILSCVTGGR